MDKANYKSEMKNGTDLVEVVKQELGEYFSNKIKAAEVIDSSLNYLQITYPLH